MLWSSCRRTARLVSFMTPTVLVIRTHGTVMVHTHQSIMVHIHQTVMGHTHKIEMGHTHETVVVHTHMTEPCLFEGDLRSENAIALVVAALVVGKHG